MIGGLRTRVRKHPIIVLYLEIENELKFYNLEARTPYNHKDKTVTDKKEGKDQESIQSSTTPDPGYQWDSDNVTTRHHKR